MDAAYADIVSLIQKALHLSPHRRILVAVAGPPGSGKTTITTHIVGLLNENSATSAVAVSVDGFHYPRTYLDNLPNREEAYVRRGAPWTFDVEAIVKLVKGLRDSASLSLDTRSVIKAPSFDHALKDPIDGDIHIDAETNIVILEGNYLLLDEEKWREISEQVDVRVFVDVGVECARARVARRHVAASIEDTYEKALARFDSNDGLNGDLIRQRLVPFDVRIESVDESK
jgi:pantothenate kinase